MVKSLVPHFNETVENSSIKFKNYGKTGVIVQPRGCFERFMHLLVSFQNRILLENMLSVDFHMLR